MSDPTPRILVVEDDPDQAHLVSRLLERVGYQVSSVATGASAVDQAELDDPDLVLMDVQLDGAMDGVEAAVLLRKRTACPVVFLTAHGDPETMDRAREAEPYGYLLKPLELRQLRPTIDTALHKARMEAEQRSLRQELDEAHATIRDLQRQLDELR